MVFPSPKLPKSGPILAEVTQVCVQTFTADCKGWPKVGQNRPALRAEFGQSRAELGRHRPQLADLTWSNFDQNGKHVDESGPDGIRPSSAELAQVWPMFDQMWPKFDRDSPKQNTIPRQVDRFRPSLYEVGHTLAEIGANETRIDTRNRSRFSKTWP